MCNDEKMFIDELDRINYRYKPDELERHNAFVEQYSKPTNEKEEEMENER